MNTDTETQTVKSIYQLSRAKLLSNAAVPAVVYLLNYICIDLIT